MPQRREKKSPSAKDRRPIKKKTSILNSESIAWIDYKDVNLLRRFMSERAKIRARREMALLPYSVRQVTQRSKGRRDRGDRGDRGELRLPSSAPSSPSASTPSVDFDDTADLADVPESGFDGTDALDGEVMNGAGDVSAFADTEDDA
jgi:small subunit ribosomal protein S18